LEATAQALKLCVADTRAGAAGVDQLSVRIVVREQ
jgi:hypothetical protein